MYYEIFRLIFTNIRCISRFGIHYLLILDLLVNLALIGRALECTVTLRNSFHCCLLLTHTFKNKLCQRHAVALISLPEEGEGLRLDRGGTLGEVDFMTTPLHLEVEITL